MTGNTTGSDVSFRPDFYRQYSHDPMQPGFARFSYMYIHMMDGVMKDNVYLFYFFRDHRLHINTKSK